MVIAFDDSAEIVLPVTTDQPPLETAIDSIQPTDRRAELKLAYKLAEAQATFYPEQLRPERKSRRSSSTPTAASPTRRN